MQWDQRPLEMSVTAAQEVCSVTAGQIHRKTPLTFMPTFMALLSFHHPLLATARPCSVRKPLGLLFA